MNNCKNLFSPYCVVWIPLSQGASDILSVDIGLATRIYLSRTQIQCLGDHKIVENSFSSIRMNNCYNIFSHHVKYGHHCSIEPLIFFHVKIGPDTPISIFRDSYPVSGLS